MPASRRKAIALLTTAAGLGILLVAGVVLYRPLEERYWLWKLREGEESEKERAADRLAELRVAEAILILISSIPRELPSRFSPFLYLPRNFRKGLPEQPYWVRALVKREGAAVPYLQETLREESVFARGYAAYILGNIGSPATDAVPDILEAVRTAMNGPKSLEPYFFSFAREALKQVSPEAEKEAAALIRLWFDRQSRA